jgi:hypothetical protein
VSADPAADAAGPELRVYLPVVDLQRQFAAYLATPTRARGYPPYEGQHALIVEVAPGLAIHRVVDLALKSVPGIEPGILFVERQFGVLEVHGRDLDDVRRAGQAILDGLGADEKDQLRPRILFSDVIEDVTDAHAIIINRNRAGSMIIPGDTLGVSEVTPALFAAVAANEAERAAPGVTLVDVSMIGAAGRIYLSGPATEVRRAQLADEEKPPAEPSPPGEGPPEVAPETNSVAKTEPSRDVKAEVAVKPPDRKTELPAKPKGQTKEKVYLLPGHEFEAPTERLPRGSVRGRFIGVTADGKWMFELPSHEIVTVPPPPSPP